LYKVVHGVVPLIAVDVLVDPHLTPKVNATHFGCGYAALGAIKSRCAAKSINNFVQPPILSPLGTIDFHPIAARLGRDLPGSLAA
jgi:hypothetical protein